MKKLLLLAIVVLGISAVSFGQASAVFEAKASATVLKVLTISKGTSELNFGVFAAKVSETSTVTLSKTGVLGGTADRYPNIGAPASLGEFQIEGTPNATFSLNLPTSFSIGNTTVGGDPMTVSSLVTDLDGATDRLGKLDETTGLKTFHVGGALAVGVNQKAGTYTGTYNVTVNYN